MKKKSLKIAVSIITIGIILAIAANLFFSIQKSPAVTEHVFDFSVTYKLDGEVKTLDGKYACNFSGFGRNGIDPILRYYDGEYAVDGVFTPSRTFTVAQKGEHTLYISVLFNEYFLMGDEENYPDHSPLEDPHIYIKDAEGYEYDLSELQGIFDAEIIDWEYPSPIENSFHFSGFSGLHFVGMAAMVFVGLIAVVLCMILVRKSEGVVYSALDIFGVLLNFAAILFWLPLLSFAVGLIQAYPTGPDWIYQVYLCIPPIVPFSVAASLALRRNGFKKSGFFIQFLSVAIMVIVAVFEYVL